MENMLDNAKKFLNTDQGKQMEQQFEKATGIDVDKYLGGQGNQGQGQQGQGQNQGQTSGGGGNNDNQQFSTDAYGNKGQPGQYGQQGQYGAVTGGGLGGALNQGQGQGAPNQSAYEGMGQDDSTSTGGYGGAAFSRKNQMGAAEGVGSTVVDSDDDIGAGYKTGTSTPGYRQEGDVDAEAAENRIRNQNQNRNVYGQQSNESAEKDDSYHEPNI